MNDSLNDSQIEMTLSEVNFCRIDPIEVENLISTEN